MVEKRVATVEVKYSNRDGFHVFSSTDLPGLLIAHKDAERAFNDVVPAIMLLMELNAGVKVRVEAAVSYEEFVRSVTTPTVAHPAAIELANRTFIVRAA